MARRLNCEGAVLYGCNEAGVVVRMWKQRSHAYAMERAAQEAIVTHRLCGVALRSRRRQARRAARGGASAPRRLGSGTTRLLVRFAAWLHVTGRKRRERTSAGCRTCAADGSRCKTSSRSVSPPMRTCGPK
ncbi:hypothetical protein TcBrA4_0138720 [Trypanosoma cruzi]|nr:hypothetical protein TcBrA4_0138720 [Trypanosoma cruzi]